MSSMTLERWSTLPKTLAPLYERYVRWLPAAVDVVLAVLIARLLAQLLWTLVPAPASAAWQPAPVIATAPNPADQVDVNRIAAAHLFGQFVPPSVKPDLAAAPDTTLNLTLLGILKNSKDKQKSRALIGNGNDEKPYSISQAVGSGVTLYAIFVDRVVLMRNGQPETLKLDKNQPSSNSAPLAVAPENDGAAESLAQVRQQMLANPLKAQDFIRIQPAPNVGGNGQMGYRIFPGKDHAVFNAAGLRAGDVVTSVNGVQLDDPAKSLQLLSDLSQAGSVTLTIQRGGESQTINVNLSQ